MAFLVSKSLLQWVIHLTGRICSLQEIWQTEWVEVPYVACKMLAHAHHKIQSFLSSLMAIFDQDSDHSGKLLKALARSTFYKVLHPVSDAYVTKLFLICKVSIWRTPPCVWNILAYLPILRRKICPITKLSPLDHRLWPFVQKFCLADPKMALETGLDQPRFLHKRRYLRILINTNRGF